MKSLSIGFSPCPNDTFIFCGLVKGHIPLSGWSLQQESLEDVETLNEWAMQGLLDITKLSFHAFGYVRDKYALLKSGAALGRGCGPLLVANRKFDISDSAKMTVALPGKYTTAAMLLKLYEPKWQNIVFMRFDEIMPAIKAGKVDCGVIIHESRFTFGDLGLVAIVDLGAWWENMSGFPLPLGGIAVKRELDKNLIGEIDRTLRASIDWAYQNREVCSSYVREHAQELEASVINDHIGLYVNDFTEELGEEGLSAVDFFLEKGIEAGIFPEPKYKSLKILY